MQFLCIAVNCFGSCGGLVYGDVARLLTDDAGLWCKTVAEEKSLFSFAVCLPFCGFAVGNETPAWASEKS